MCFECVMSIIGFYSIRSIGNKTWTLRRKLKQRLKQHANCFCSVYGAATSKPGHNPLSLHAFLFKYAMPQRAAEETVYSFILVIATTEMRRVSLKMKPNWMVVICSQDLEVRMTILLHHPHKEVCTDECPSAAESRTTELHCTTSPVSRQNEPPGLDPFGIYGMPFMCIGRTWGCHSRGSLHFTQKKSSCPGGRDKRKRWILMPFLIFMKSIGSTRQYLLHQLFCITSCPCAGKYTREVHLTHAFNGKSGPWWFWG